jgi:YVTN family beta-propeller protein
MYVEELPVFFQRPHALALEPRSGTVYTASLATNQMHAINPAIGHVKLIEVAGPPHALMQFAVSPDGRTLAVSAELSHRVLFYDITKPMAPVLLGEVEVGRQPFDPIFTRDGLQLYLGNKGANTVTVIDVEKRTVAEVIRGAGIAQPHGIAVSPDGHYVYVSNNNLSQTHDMAAHQPGQPMPAAAPAGRGTVVVIDTRTRAIAQVIEVGNNATGIGTRTLAP